MPSDWYKGTSEGIRVCCSAHCSASASRYEPTGCRPKDEGNVSFIVRCQRVGCDWSKAVDQFFEGIIGGGEAHIEP